MASLAAITTPSSLLSSTGRVAAEAVVFLDDCCSEDGNEFGFVETAALVEVGRISAALSSDDAGTSGAHAAGRA